MATVTKHTRIFLGAGHHRHPRNPQEWIEQPANPDVSGRDPVNPTVLNAQSVFYQINGQVLPTQFLFWGLSDGTYSRTEPNPHLVEPAGDASLTIIEWHYLPGGGTGPGSAELIDAYDSLSGGFFDDPFVTVSDPALNAQQVNDDGAVPTARAEAITALDTISGHSFRFAQWVVDVANDASVASGHGLAIPAGSNGFAIAAYDTPKVTKPSFPSLNVSAEEVIQILWGVINDAPGYGGKPGGPYGPIDPGWGSAVKDIVALAAITLNSERLPAAEGRQIRAAALKQLGSVAARIASFARAGVARE